MGAANSRPVRDQFFPRGLCRIRNIDSWPTETRDRFGVVPRSGGAPSKKRETQKNIYQSRHRRQFLVRRTIDQSPTGSGPAPSLVELYSASLSRMGIFHTCWSWFSLICRIGLTRHRSPRPPLCRQPRFVLAEDPRCRPVWRG